MRITNHLLDEARYCPSENQDERPHGEISLIVVHCISLPAGHYGGNFIERLFCNRLDSNHPDFDDLEGLRVSSHLLVRRDGSVVQFVPFDRRAWHAGVSHHGAREACNDFSVGIELEGIDSAGYRDAQYSSLVTICRKLTDCYHIPKDAIVGHSDIAPGRKTDPGPFFDWPRLRNGVSSA